MVFVSCLGRLGLDSPSRLSPRARRAAAPFADRADLQLSRPVLMSLLGRQGFIHTSSWGPKHVGAPVALPQTVPPGRLASAGLGGWRNQDQILGLQRFGITHGLSRLKSGGDTENHVKTRYTHVQLGYTWFPVYASAKHYVLIAYKYIHGPSNSGRKCAVVVTTVYPDTLG